MKQRSETDILGVDVGGVILDFMRHFDTDLDFDGENYLQTPEINDAIDSLAELNKERFKGRIYLVSRYHAEHGGPSRVLEWLSNRDFFETTGIPQDHFHSCAERHEKAPICVELGISHFVDDRAEVLSHMIGKVENLYLFRSPDVQREEFASILPRFHQVSSWSELMVELKSS